MMMGAIDGLRKTGQVHFCHIPKMECGLRVAGVTVGLQGACEGGGV
jgi:hypothetical protein